MQYKPKFALSFRRLVYLRIRSLNGDPLTAAEAGPEFMTSPNRPTTSSWNYHLSVHRAEQSAG